MGGSDTPAPGPSGPTLHPALPSPSSFLLPDHSQTWVLLGTRSYCSPSWMPFPRGQHGRVTPVLHACGSDSRSLISPSSCVHTCVLSPLPECGDLWLASNDRYAKVMGCPSSGDISPQETVLLGEKSPPLSLCLSPVGSGEAMERRSSLFHSQASR